MTNRKRYLTDVTEAEWRFLAPLTPATPQTGRPRTHAWREILNAIFYVVRGGIAWRMLPHDLPPWQTVYHYFRQWRKDGTWEHWNSRLRESVRHKVGRDKEPSAAVLDSQSVKCAEGGEAIGYDNGKQIHGRKRHILVDTLGLLLLVIVTSASIQDRDGAKLLLQRLFDHGKKSVHNRWCRLKLIWADSAYGGELILWVKKNLGWALEIIKKLEGQKGFQVLPKRWKVERTFGWLTRNRRLSRDYERLPETSEAFIYITMIRLMTRRLAA